MAYSQSRDQKPTDRPTLSVDDVPGDLDEDPSGYKKKERVFMIGKVISHYKILEEVGRGGMGVVYKAEDTKLGRPVAIKLLSLGRNASKDQTNRFIREARAAASVSHPNIATVFELGEIGDPSTHSLQAFIAMEFIEGKTLEKFLPEGSLTIDQIRDIAEQVGRGLKSAHDRGIIHRDIKPSNVILSTEGVAKILDFGLAKLPDDTTFSQTGMVAGSVAYMSPEQVRGEKLDHRTDIWSFGVLIFQLLSGRAPFRGDHAPAMMYSILNEPPADIRKLVPGLPNDLAEICGECLQKEKGDRPPSMNDILLQMGVREKGPSGVQMHRVHHVLQSRRTLAGTLILLFGIVGSVYLFTSASAIDLSPNDYVLITAISNTTGDSVFSSSVTEAIRVSLRQSRRFSILPGDRIPPALQRMGLPENDPIDEETGLLLARREGIRAVLATSISRLGTKYVLAGRIIDVGTGEPAALVRQEVAGIEDVLSGIDRLSEDVREALGESISEISETTKPLAQVTTSSLEALEQYSRGDALERQGRYEEAAILKGRAVELDSMFTMAVSDLSYIHRKLGNDSLALAFHRRVLPLIDRVTEPERYLILALYYGPSFELDFRMAYQSVQQLVVRYPHSAEGLATLGHLAMFAGDFEQAIDADARCLALDSVYRGTVLNNMGFAYSFAGKASEALECYRQSKRIRPGYLTIDLYMARAWWLSGQFDSTQGRLKAIAAYADPRSSINVLLHLASYYHFRGQLENARKACLEGLRVSRSLGRRGDESWFLYLSGEVAIEQGRRGEYLDKLRDAMEKSQQPFIEYVFAGASLARRGFSVEANHALRRLNALESGDPYFTKRKGEFRAFVEAELALSDGSFREALEKFQSVQKIHAGDPLYFLAQRGAAECLFGLSDSSWAGVSQSILDRRAEIVTGLIPTIRASGYWITDLWPDLQARTGVRLLESGDTDNAVVSLSQALEIWRDSDAGFERATRARVALARLKGR
ncbi:MAG: serine/threonine-protein kinase [Bacteroidota bacterium]